MVRISAMKGHCCCGPADIGAPGETGMERFEERPEKGSNRIVHFRRRFCMLVEYAISGYLLSISYIYPDI